MEWIFLLLAIALEISATSLLKISSGFTKILPAAGSMIGYVLCFYFLSLSLKKIELGVAYAIWSAVGIVVLSSIGIIFFKESINALKVVSIILIIAGVVGLNLSGISH